ncbi:MAG: amino acid permease [Lactobacillus sp.]|nr:amino acid permease [Lactobacillus sp.]MDN6052867.1 amino acid permease [Lactobacillus sp.]
MQRLWHKMIRKERPDVYEDKDSHLTRTLGVKELLGLGLGIVIGAAIFTLPGIVAAEHAGPAVALSFIFAAIGAGFAALAYGEMAAALPFAGSAYSWMNVVFGEVFGWIAGWALLAEYFVSVAFVASGWSSYFRGFLASIDIHLPPALTMPFDPQTGGIVDLFAVLLIVLVFWVLNQGLSHATRLENVIVILKVVVVLLFVFVGLREIHWSNYVPFIPKHRPGTSFGGIPGIWAGTSQIFLAYVGFDAIAANSAEAKNPQRTMPLGIIGTLLGATTLFVIVALVLVGMFKYSVYANNAEPAAWALRHTGHYLTANLLSLVALAGMFAAILGMMLAASRLLYSFGRDGMLPRRLGQLNQQNLPGHALNALTIGAIVVSSVVPFTFLANLVSAGTLIAFIFVSLGIYALRRREGKDIPVPAFKMPFYPVLPAVSALLSMIIFAGLSIDGKLLALGWFVVGLLIYAVYGIRHSVLNKKS